MAVLFKTLTGTIPANTNEITFTDSMINSNTIVEAYYNNNDVYTLETWQEGITIGIVTNDHDFPVGIKITLNNVTSFEPYDDSEIVQDISDIEDAVSGLAIRVGDAEDDIDDLENNISSLDTNKQNKLTAGANITIVDDVISATGGSGVSWGSPYSPTSYSFINVNDEYTVENTGLLVVFVNPSSSSQKIVFKFTNNGVTYASAWANNGDQNTIIVPVNAGDTLTVIASSYLSTVSLTEIPLLFN